MEGILTVNDFKRFYSDMDQAMLENAREVALYDFWKDDAYSFVHPLQHLCIQSSQIPLSSRKVPSPQNKLFCEKMGLTDVMGFDAHDT